MAVEIVQALEASMLLLSLSEKRWCATGLVGSEVIVGKDWPDRYSQLLFERRIDRLDQCYNPKFVFTDTLDM